MTASAPCPRCNAPNPVTAGFCGRCGSPLARQQRSGPPSSYASSPCPACGFSGNRPDTAFCSECGVLLPVRRPAGVKKRWLFGILIAVLLLGAAIVALWLGSGRELPFGLAEPSSWRGEPQEPVLTVVTPETGGAAATSPTPDPPQEPDATAPDQMPSQEPLPTEMPPATATAEPSPAPTPGPAGLLAFVSNRDGSDSLYLLDVANPGSARRLTTATGYDWWPSWCGSDELAFERTDQWPRATSQEIAVVALGGGEPALLTSPSFPPNSFFNGLPSCSPDGALLAFSSRSTGAQSSNEFRVGVLDRRATPAAFNLVGDGYPLAGNASWSPDRSQLVFMHYSAASRRFLIYRTSLQDSGAGAANLTPGSGTYKYPDWSPAGNRIAYACARREGEDLLWGLCIVDAAGGSEQRVLDQLHRGPEQTDDGAWTRHAVTPSWSPDGRWIAVAADREGSWDIYLYDVQTGALTNLTETPSWDEIHPAWGGR